MILDVKKIVVTNG